MQGCHRELTAGGRAGGQRPDWGVMAFCLGLALVYVLVFSFTTSFLFHGQSLNDSALFQIVGKYWAQGYLPYRDLFDNKGPVIYLINAVPYLLGDGRLLWVLQCINLTVAFYYAFRILCVAYDRRMSLALTALTMACMTLCTEGGNSVEEYILPWLMCSCFYLVRYPVSSLPLRASFVFGLTLAVALLTRPNDGLGLVGAVLVAAVFVLRERGARAVFSHLAVFLLGVLALSAPFMVYLAATHTLGDWWYACYVYNMEYARSFDLSHPSCADALKWLKSYSPCYVLFLVSLVMTLRRDRRGLVWLGASLLTLLWFVFGQQYGHYGIVAVPFFCIVCCLVRGSRRLRSAYWVMVLLGFLYECRSSFLIYHERDKWTDTYKSMLHVVPAGERSRVMGYNVGPEFYFYNDIRPIYPYFAMQEIGASKGHTLLPKMRRCFNEGRATWLIVKGRDNHLEDIFSRRYVLVKTDSSQEVRLLKLKSD